MNNLSKILLTLDICLIIFGFYGYLNEPSFKYGVYFGFGLCSLIYFNWLQEDL